MHRDQRERALQLPAHLPHRLGQLTARTSRPRRADARRPRCPSRTPTRVRGRRVRPAVAAKFSMMPLCTTETRPALSRCGWAFSSVGPPWVAHRVCPMPGRAGRQRTVRQLLLQVGEFAGLLRRGQPAVGQHGDTRRVVAAVLQPLQPGEDDVQGALPAHISHDSAHGGSLRRPPVNTRALSGGAPRAPSPGTPRPPPRPPRARCPARSAPGNRRGPRPDPRPGNSSANSAYTRAANPSDAASAPRPLTPPVLPHGRCPSRPVLRARTRTP